MHVSKKKKIKIKEKKNRAYAWSKLWIFPQHAFNKPSTDKKKKKKTQIRKTTAVSQPTAVMKKREHYFKNIITFY
jgi:hypothetical protein